MLKGILTLVAVCGLMVLGPIGCDCCGKCEADLDGDKKPVAKEPAKAK